MLYIIITDQKYYKTINAGVDYKKNMKLSIHKLFLYFLNLLKNKKNSSKLHRLPVFLVDPVNCTRSEFYDLKPGQFSR